jgi:hypothetical protein
MSDISCNICGGQTFTPMRSRPDVRCAGCASLERTRVVALQLKKHGLPQPGSRVLHLAPEPGLSNYLSQRVGAENYHAYDLEPERFSFCKVERLDLCSEAETLPSDTFHLVVHVHVIEHVPCNYAAVLYHLHRALHPDGLHVMCIPFLDGAYDECWAALSGAERVRRFGQNDHMRRFGTEDVQRSLGALFELPAEYDLEKEFGAELLERHRIPGYARRGFTPHTVLMARKRDWKLAPR